MKKAILMFAVVSSVSLLSGCASGNYAPVPAGFTDTGDGLALKAVGKCTQYVLGGCTALEVAALRDCPNGVTVAINALDKNDRIIEAVSKSLPSLMAGKHATLEYPVNSSGVAKTEIAKVTCS